MTESKSNRANSRRSFLKTVAAGGVAAAASSIAAPNISRAQTVVLKMQGSWGAQDIFNEMAEDYAKRVNEMAGGRLKIDYLVGGAVVKPFSVQDAVHSGVLDGCHTVAAYWYGKHKAASLFGTAPVYGWHAEQALGWIYHGGGLELYNELVQKILGLNIVGFFAFPMPTQPLGWFKREIKSADDVKGLKYRTVGLAADVMQAMGARVTQLPGGEIVPAMERGVIDAFEYNNPTSDRRFGAQDVAKIYMLGSYHQAMEFFEINFNKTKYESLPKELQSILRYAVEAASADNLWKAYKLYSDDLQALIHKDKVKVVRTPESVMKLQLEAWDKVLADLEKDPFFKKVTDSQKAWAKKVAYYELVNAADYKLAYNHYFGKEQPLGF
ncbi:MAG TPA: TRAP transporter substrate-binding protein [Alphaproteobacteria bacterium]